MLQIVAIITMLIDHTGRIFFPDQILWQIIGRIAFPIYAYLLVVGYRHTRSVKRYTVRLFFLALVSQLPFMLSVNPTGINAIGTLLICLLVLYGLDHINGMTRNFIIVAAGLLLELLPFDYGSYALLLVLIYRYYSRAVIGLHVALNFFFIFYKGWYLEIFSIVPTILIFGYPKLNHQVYQIRVPSWLWRSFYPAHLLVLALLIK